MPGPDALRITHGHISAVLPSQTSILIALDPAACILVWNVGAERTFGPSEEEMRGRPFLRCPIAWDWERLTALVPDGIPRSTRRIVMDATCRDGRQRRIVFQVKPQYRASNALAGCLWLGTATAAMPGRPVPEVPTGSRHPSDPAIPAVDALRLYPLHVSFIDAHLAAQGEDPARWSIAEAVETRLDDDGMEVRFRMSRRIPFGELVLRVLVARGRLVAVAPG